MFKTLVLACLAFFALSAHAIQIGQDNVVSGNCRDLAARIKNNGVTDEGGSHPGRPGNTHATVEVQEPKYKIHFKPGPDGGVCAFTSLKIKLKVTSVSTRLDWSPDAQSAKTCKDERKAWIARITSHEGDHVKDNNRLESEYNKNVESKTYEVCDGTQEAAGKALEKQVAADADAATSELQAQIKKAADVYHAAHGASVPSPNCCKQGRTYCSCDNPGQGKPRNYDSETECMVKCPSGLRCFATQCTEP